MEEAKKTAPPAAKGAAANDTDHSGVPRGVWVKCKSCREVLFAAELERNLMVCPQCDYHFPLSARKRIELMTDAGSFVACDTDLAPVDILEFTDSKPYPNRLKDMQRKTGLKDAILAGQATLEGMPIAIAAMEFGFVGGSMGCVVGETLARTFARGLEKKCPVIVVAASGGARMQEGIMSLMQMAKTNAGASLLAAAGLPFLVVISDPTTAGVMASFASVGDVVIAEPGSLMGFAGARVIKETIRRDLPPGFQRAEFQMEHGFVDVIAHRRDVPRVCAQLCRVFMARRSV